jgi:hypothetical protein
LIPVHCSFLLEGDRFAAILRANNNVLPAVSKYGLALRDSEGIRYCPARIRPLAQPASAATTMTVIAPMTMTMKDPVYSKPSFLLLKWLYGYLPSLDLTFAL